MKYNIRNANGILQKIELSTDIADLIRIARKNNLGSITDDNGLIIGIDFLTNAIIIPQENDKTKTPAKLSNLLP